MAIYPPIKANTLKEKTMFSTAEQTPFIGHPQWRPPLVHLAAVHGKITAISGASLPATVTIASSYGKTIAIAVRAGTKINRNKQPATMGDLREDDIAAAAYDTNNWAVALEVYSQSFLQGWPKKTAV
jgi:hypothetical protein